MELEIIKTTHPKNKPDFNQLGFGKYFTDHMLIMKYKEGQGWYQAQIKAYEPISLSPSALIFHYGQETFEGLKAYKNKKGQISLFRPMDNLHRMNRSNDRMCMPMIDPEFVLDALKKLLVLDSEWIPTEVGTSLYIRPFMIATEESLGVKVSSEYLFMIILSPVGSYYAEGLKPTSIHVEDQYARAMQGGTGEAKCGGNYAVSLKPYEMAKKAGYSQVLFLDGKDKKYIEEIGTSNAFFVIDNEIITTPLVGTILPGITRDSIIRIAKDKGYKVSERLLSIEEIENAYDSNKLNEAFASGTAAVISPIGVLTYKDKKMVINNNEIGKISQELYDSLTSIQTGVVANPYQWVMHIN
ncbi:MAG: branched-chain amino acid aminotransferase [Anaerofustis sp.]